MILRGVSVVLPAQIVKLIVSLAIQIVIARLLLPDGRGLYGVCLAISAALLILTYFGNEFGVRHLLVKKSITSGQALRYLLITVLFSWITAVAITFIAVRAEVWLPVGMTWPLLFLACSASFSQLVSTQINVFMTLRGQFVAAATIAIVEEVLKLTLIVLLLFRFRTVEVALLATLIGSFMIAAASIIYGGFLKRDFEALRLDHLNTIYGYGLRSIWLNMSNLSNAHIGTLVLSGLMPNAQIGIYNLAFGLVARLQVIPDALNRVLVAASAQYESEDDRMKMIQTSVAGLVLFCLGVLPIFAAFNEPIIEFMFGSEYIAAGPIAFLLLVGFSFKIIGKPLEAHFNEISGRPGSLGFTLVFMMIMMASLTYVGATRYGLFGAAIGSSAALIMGSIALLALHARLTGCSVASMFNFRPLFARLRDLRRKEL